MAFRKHLPTGTRVQLTAGMGVREGRVNYRYGTVKSCDGEYYTINVEYSGPIAKYRASGIDCDRYLCEIEKAFINGEWVYDN